MSLALPLLALSLAVSQASSAEIPELFHGVGRCLALENSQVLTAGEPLVVVAPGVPPTNTRAGTVVQAPGKGRDCRRLFSAEPPAGIMSLSLPEALDDKVFFAIRKPPKLVIISGLASRLPTADTARWVKTISSSLPAQWRVPGVLAHAYQYRGSGRSAVELYLGQPTRNPVGSSPPIGVITIRRLFIVDGRLRASEEYRRESGVEERVDTEAPQLTFENWSVSGTEQTVAFLSTNKGAAWTRLSTNIGFEGYNWIAESLRDGLPRTYHRFLYTSH